MAGANEAPPERSRLARAVESGARLASALLGGSVGLLGGPAGALGGAAAGWAAGEWLPRIGAEVVARVGERGAVRTGAALVLIESDAKQRREGGQARRDDGFFEPRGELRPDSEELLEAVLRQAAETYEERKLPYLSRLYSTVAYEPNVSAAEALYLVRVAGELTYRQLIALGVYANREEHVRALADAQGRQDEGRAEADESIVLELSDLADRRLVGIGRPGNTAPLSNVFEGLFPRDKAGWGQLALLPAGERLARLTGADRINAAEREAWIEALAGRYVGP